MADKEREEDRLMMLDDAQQDLATSIRGLARVHKEIDVVEAELEALQQKQDELCKKVIDAVRNEREVLQRKRDELCRAESILLLSRIASEELIAKYSA